MLPHAARWNPSIPQIRLNRGTSPDERYGGEAPVAGPLLSTAPPTRREGFDGRRHQSGHHARTAGGDRTVGHADPSGGHLGDPERRPQGVGDRGGPATRAGWRPRQPRRVVAG